MNDSKLQADDFTTMYTMLPHDGLIAGVSSAIDDAVKERRHSIPLPAVFHRERAAPDEPAEDCEGQYRPADLREEAEIGGQIEGFGRPFAALAVTFLDAGFYVASVLITRN